MYYKKNSRVEYSSVLKGYCKYLLRDIISFSVVKIKKHLRYEAYFYYFILLMQRSS